MSRPHSTAPANLHLCLAHPIVAQATRHFRCLSCVRARRPRARRPDLSPPRLVVAHADLLFRRLASWSRTPTSSWSSTPKASFRITGRFLEPGTSASASNRPQRSQHHIFSAFNAQVTSSLKYARTSQTHNSKRSDLLFYNVMNINEIYIYPI
jgi:hypothetical protein